MSGSLNKVSLIGNLGQDPEVRATHAGNRVVTLNVATNETWKDSATGERRTRTEWHKVVIWPETIGLNAERYLRKGSQVYVEGVLRTRKWTDATGVERSAAQVEVEAYNGTVTFLDSKPRDGATGSAGSRAPARAGNDGRGDDTTSNAVQHCDLDDEVPF